MDSDKPGQSWPPRIDRCDQGGDRHMSELLTLLLGIVVVVGITAGTGYFVAQEFAYMTVDRSRLEARSKAGDTVAARTLAVTKRTSFMLSGAQLGITVTGLLVGNFAEPLIGQSLGTLLGGVGIPSGVGLAVGAVTALVVSTFVQMLFGELFPRTSPSPALNPSRDGSRCRRRSTSSCSAGSSVSSTPRPTRC